MELKELTDKTLELFGVSSPEKLPAVLMDACGDEAKLQAFYDLVGGDLSVDWMQRIYQYYLADRKEKKQDYTPPSIAQFMGMLAGRSAHVIDMCAGSGALIIQKWRQDPEAHFTAIEYDENVIPFLIFNMTVRNIKCRVLHADALSDDGVLESWDISKGEKFGRITHI